MDLRPFALVPAPVVAAAPHYQGAREQPLKTWFPDIYWYNFFQQFKDHFTPAGAMGPNQVLFAATFLKNIALFRWQQHQRKIENKTNIPINWEKFKAFLRQSLGKSKAFIDTIWRTIRKDF